MRTAIFPSFLFAAVASASGGVLEIPLAPGEKWWGGAGGSGEHQPYSAASGYYAKMLKYFAAKFGIKGFKFNAGDPWRHLSPEGVRPRRHFSRLPRYGRL